MVAEGSLQQVDSHLQPVAVGSQLGEAVVGNLREEGGGGGRREGGRREGGGGGGRRERDEGGGRREGEE